MSYEAMRWAMSQTAKSSAKFVLVAMADCVNSDGGSMVCWPSVQHLADMTSQDRKTVIDNLRRLREAGFLEDTKQRRGVTGQVVVYLLKSPVNGTIEKAGEQHYTYRLTDPKTGQFYLGVRSCHGDPEKDTQYRGSGRWCYLRTSADGKLDKQVLATYLTRTAAEGAERELIAAHIADPMCMNRASNSAETGTVRGLETVPLLDGNSTAFPYKESRFSLLTVPKAGHGTSKEPIKNQEGTSKKRGGFDASLIDVPDWMDADAWKRWAKDRKSRGKAITEDAARLQLATLQRFLSDGYAPAVVIDNAIENGWQGLYEPKGKKSSGRHSGFAEKNYREGVEADGSFH